MVPTYSLYPAVQILTFDIAHLNYGSFLLISILYFHKWRKLDSCILQTAVFICVLLESIAAALRLEMLWSFTIHEQQTSSFQWKTVLGLIIRLPGVAISQTYFSWLIYSLFDRRAWVGVLLILFSSGIFGIGETAFIRYLLDLTKPNPSQHTDSPSGQAHLFKTYIMMLIVMDLIISISLAIKLMGLRSSMKSSDKAIHFMVRNLFVSNVILTVFSIATFVTFTYNATSAWSRIPFELLYHSYLFIFLLSLISRGTTRRLVHSPLHAQHDLDMSQTVVSMDSHPSCLVQRKLSSSSSSFAKSPRSLKFGNHPCPLVEPATVILQSS